MPTRRVPRPAPKKPPPKKKPEPVATNDARPLEWLTAVRKSKTLTRNDKKVLWAFGTYADGATGANSRPGDPLAAEELGVSVDTVERARKSGIARGYLRLTKKGHGGTPPRADVYQLTLPKTSTANGDTNTANTDDPNTAKEGAQHRKKREQHRTHADLPHQFTSSDTCSFIEENHHEPSASEKENEEEHDLPCGQDEDGTQDDEEEHDHDLGSAQDERQPVSQDDTSAGDEAVGDGSHPGLIDSARSLGLGGLPGLDEPFSDGDEEDAGTRQLRDTWRTTLPRLVSELVREHPEWSAKQPVNKDYVKKVWTEAGLRLCRSILKFAEAMNWYAHAGAGQGANGVGYLANPKNPKWERAVPDYQAMLHAERAERDQAAEAEAAAEAERTRVTDWLAARLNDYGRWDLTSTIIQSIDRPVPTATEVGVTADEYRRADRASGTIVSGARTRDLARLIGQDIPEPQDDSKNRPAA